VTADHAALAAAAAAVVDRHVRPGGPGLVHALVVEGEVVARGERGLGLLEHGLPIDRSSRFYLCSLAKQMTAAVVLRLVLDGIVAPDDDPRRWVPELGHRDQEITLRHLLHHTSGIRDYLALQVLAGDDFEDRFDRDDALTLVARQDALEFAPGARHAYGNSGYLLLAIVAERATGCSWPELVEQHVFAPLGMSGANVPGLGEVVTGLVGGYSRAGGGSFRRRGLRHVVPGPGGITATIDDVIAWERVLAGAALGDDLRALLLAPGALADGTVLDYAGGLALGARRGLPTVGHGGGFPGWSTWITHVPAIGASAIVLANDDGIAAGAVVEELLDLVLDAHGIAAASPSPDATAAAASSVAPVVEARPGRYVELTMGDSWDVRAEAGVLQVGRHGAWTPLRRLDDGTYAAPGRDVLRFHPDSAAVVRGGRTFATYERHDPVHASPAPYCGGYVCGELGLVLTFDDAGGVLRLQRGQRVAQPLTPTVVDSFSAPFGQVRFARDASGAVTGGTIGNMQAHDLTFRRPV
jgi:CubicO group peptidase (beta-lactamase class C family)